MSTVTTTFLYGEDTELTVIWTHYPAYCGQRDSLGGVRGAGPPLEPDDPEELEFIQALDSQGKEVDLPTHEIKRAKEMAWEQLANQCDE